MRTEKTANNYTRCLEVVNIGYVGQRSSELNVLSITILGPRNEGEGIKRKL